MIQSKAEMDHLNKQYYWKQYEVTWNYVKNYCWTWPQIWSKFPDLGAMGIRVNLRTLYQKANMSTPVGKFCHQRRCLGLNWSLIASCPLPYLHTCLARPALILQKKLSSKRFSSQQKGINWLALRFDSSTATTAKYIRQMQRVTLIQFHFDMAEKKQICGVGLLFVEVLRACASAPDWQCSTKLIRRVDVFFPCRGK